MSEKLEELKRQKFTPEGKQERVAKALEALGVELVIDLPIEVLKWLAEDPDLEESALNAAPR